MSLRSHYAPDAPLPLFSTRRCPACKVEKSDAAFTLRTKCCRECRRESNKARYATPERKAKMAAYREAYRQANRDRHRAWNAVEKAIRKGKLNRGVCEVCRSPEVEAHHDDYSKPLVVRWLCDQHHTGTHHRNRSHRFTSPPAVGPDTHTAPAASTEAAA